MSLTAARMGQPTQGTEGPGVTRTLPGVTIQGENNLGGLRTIRTDDNGQLIAVVQQSDGAAANVQGVVLDGANGGTVKVVSVGGFVAGGPTLVANRYVNPLTDAQAETYALVAASRGQIQNLAGTWDRLKTAQAGENTGNPGVPGAALMAWDGANYFRANGGNFNADGILATQIGMDSRARDYQFNDTDWERVRGNTSAGLLIGSGSRSIQTAGTQQINRCARGVLVSLNVTGASGTGGLTLRIQGASSPSGTGSTMRNLNAAPAAVIAISTTTYVLYPGVGAAAGDVTQQTSGILPRDWRIEVFVGDGTSYTYSVTFALLL